MSKVSLLRQMMIGCTGNKAMKFIFSAFILCIMSYVAHANVTVTAATGGTNICHNGAADGTLPAWTTLGTITISESAANNDFTAGAGVLVLNLPAGWQFNTAAVITLNFTGGANITAVTNGGISATTLAIDITTGGGISRHDQVTITGLQVQPTSQASATGNIYASTATRVTGVVTGAAGTNFGTLTETGPAIYTVTGGGGYCIGGTGSDIQLSGSDATANYQLYNDGVISGGSIAGTGAAPFDLGLQMAAGTYTVLATNGTGCTSIMNGNATVVIDPLPSVYNVTGGGSYCPGGTGEMIDLSFSDVGVNYNLYNGATLMATLPGAISSLTFGPETAVGTYTVQAQNTSTGCTNNMNGSAAISLLPAPTQFTVTGLTSYCASAAGVDIGLSGSVAGTTYQLYNGAAAAGMSQSGSGPALDFGTQPAGSYSVLATITATGCTGPMSNTLNVSINPLPNVYTVGGGGSYCFGGIGVQITLSNSDAGINYQVYYGSAPVGAVVGGTGAMPTDLGLETGAGTYTVLATDATTGCTNNMSDSATVFINPLPLIFSMTGGGSYCMGGTGVDVGLSGSVVGTNYELFNGATYITTLAGTGSALDFGLQMTAGSYTVVAFDAVTLCTSNMSGSATVTINALPNVYTISAGGGYCAGGPGVDLTLTGSDAGVNYQVYMGATMEGGIVAGTGAAPTDLGFQTAAGTYSVLATNTTTGCMNAMAGTASITINPLPNVFTVTGGGSYCAGGTGVAVGLSGSTTGVNYQLYDGITMMGAAIGGTTGSAINFGLETAAGIYTVLATDGTTFCTNDMNGSATVVINPLPTAYTVTGGGGYCAGGTGADVGLGSSDTGISYQLYNGASLSGSPLAGTGTGLDFGLQTGAGTYSVVGTNTVTGCSDNMAGSVTVTINPLPNTYTVTGGGSSCAGGSFHVGLSGSDAVNMSYQLYINTVPSGLPITGTGAALDFGLFTTAGSYLVVATNTVTLCNALMSGSATIIINPNPAPIGGTTSVCLNSSDTLSDDSLGGTWSSNNVFVASINSVGLMTGAGAGATTITYTLPTTCYATTSVTVNPLPVVAAITGTTNECIGSGNTLADATGSGVWSSTDITIATIGPAAGTVTGVAAGMVTISYTVTNGFGCVSAATTPDTVNALPVVGPISGPLAVCISTPATLMDGVTGGVWGSSDITIATIDPAMGTITGVAAGTVTMSYTVTSMAGCTTTVTSSETVNPSPAVSAINGPTNICLGLTASLSDTTSGGVWSISDITIASVNTTGTVTSVAVGTATISYTVSNGFGCFSSAVDNFTVGNAMPASSILPAGSTTLCGGTPVNLVLSPAGSGLTYQWAINGNAIAGATNGSYITDTAGSFSITVNNGMCSETLPAATVLAPPDPVISYNSATNYLYTSSFHSYQWYKNGTPITGANSSTLPVTGIGVYKVVVSDADGCYVASAPYTITGSGGGGGGGGGGGSSSVNNTTTITGIRVYPNPATSTLYIDAPVAVNISVISPDGKVVLSQKQATDIDVSQLANGLYIIMIYDENNALLKAEKFAKIN